MIIVNLKGGLGNQMFQYACGRALSLRAKARGEKDDLALDVSGYKKLASADTVRSYELEEFNIASRAATDQEISSRKYPFGIISKAWRYLRAKVLRKFYINFDPQVLSWNGDIYLDGFWQSEKYFKDFEKEIRADFTLKKPFGPEAQKWHEKISHDPYAVSLHIRRGDYAKDKATNKHWGTCNMEYYAKALNEIAKSVPKPNVYVFSDDIAWAKENLKSDFPLSFVSASGIANQEEMMLMAASKHNIIANSTFSWWGAWLNQNPAKIVISPLRWANEHNNDWYGDIIPDTWKRL